jgi:chromosome segregation ATPase
MNIDERLEALTHSVELLASFHKDNEKRMERVIQGMERLTKADARLEGLVTQLAEGTARLLHVAQAHEQRLDRLEGDRPPV